MQEGTHLLSASPEESNQGLRSSLNWNLFQTDPVLPCPPSLVMTIMPHSSPSLPPLPTQRTALAGGRWDTVQTDQSATTREDTTLTVHGGIKLRDHLALLLQLRPTSNIGHWLHGSSSKAPNHRFYVQCKPFLRGLLLGHGARSKMAAHPHGQKIRQRLSSLPEVPGQSALSMGFQLCAQGDGAPP